MKESLIQQAIRIEASRRGCLLLRNNSGACQDSTGRQIRYGLGNDSAQINKAIKSSDLIGIYPVLITPDMVGQTLGVFLAVECKRPGWYYTGTEREAAQLKFHEIVKKHGGYGLFATGPQDIWK